MTPIAMFPIMAALSLPMPKEEFKDSVFSISKAGEVVVTATRTPKLLKNTPVQTRVISRRDIERSDATNIQDLLTQTMPGAEFTYAMNQQTHLNFSGFGGQGLLFLVDGERMAGETMDDVDFSRITLENVERIEIVRGAASALYGSNAVGGVVNVITRNNAKSWTAQVNARLAKHGEQRYTAAMGLANKHVSNSLCANFSKTDNYDVHSAPNPVTRIITTIYGDKVLNLNDRFRWQPTEQLTFTARAGYYWRETVRTADVPEHYRSFSGGAKMEWRPTAHDNLSLTYAFDQYDKSDHLRRQNLELRDYSNVQNSVKLLYNHSFSKQHLLTLGVDYLHDYLMNVNLKNRIREQDCLGVYAQHDWEISPEWEVVGGVRYDYLSDRNLSHLTPRLNLRYRPQHNLTLRLGYGMGFRSPTLKERYYNFDMSGIWIVEGTPDLRPEKATTLRSRPNTPNRVTTLRLRFTTTTCRTKLPQRRLITKSRATNCPTCPTSTSPTSRCTVVNWASTPDGTTASRLASPTPIPRRSCPPTTTVIPSTTNTFRRVHMRSTSGPSTNIGGANCIARISV